MKERKINVIDAVAMLAFCAVFLVAPLLMPAFTSQAASSKTVIPTDVSTPTSGCTFVGVEGSYISQVDAAIARINVIRKEACDEGVLNPSTNKPLTSSDYVPIKWSSSLEYIAKIRAAEAVIVQDHTRPNGSSCFTLKAPDGQQSWGEVLAWNSSKSVVNGINQWYEEKADWVAQNQSAVTGHYTQMIDPGNTYVGLGCFYSENAAYPNCTAGEFSSAADMDSTPRAVETDIIQTIEIQNTQLTVFSIKELSGGKAEAGSTLQYGANYKVTSSYGAGYVSELGTVQWESSDPTIATVDNDGKVMLLKSGSVTIKGTSASTGQSATSEIKVKGSSGDDTVKPDDTSSTGQDTVKPEDTSNKDQDTVKPDDTSNTGEDVTTTGEDTAGADPDDALISGIKSNKAKIKSLKKSGNGLKASWKKVTVTGASVKYQIQYKKKGTSKWTTKTTTKTSLTIKKLKKGKTYTVKVRPFIELDSGTYYGKWSSTKSGKV